MSIIIGSQSASAAFDLSIYYSAISRSLLHSQCGQSGTSRTFQSLVTISSSYFACSLFADFFVFDDPRGFHTILGLQFLQKCQELHCTEFVLGLPRIQSDISPPLPLFPSQVAVGSSVSYIVPGLSSSSGCFDLAGNVGSNSGLGSSNFCNNSVDAIPSHSLVAAPHIGRRFIHGNPAHTSLNLPSSSTLPVDVNTKPSSLHLLRSLLLRSSVTGVH
ncbi:hypothetical protein EV368DRAFT_83706 [Lentinula lateritia]|nr:hypothetical protein EV368DRAFT_83706 [Lentinula lateritia]